MRSVRPSWAPLPRVLPLLGIVRPSVVQAGPRAGNIYDWGLLTQPLANMGSCCMPGTVLGQLVTGDAGEGYWMASPEKECWVVMGEL